MRFGVMSGVLWGLDTVVLGVALALAPYAGGGALGVAAIAGSFLHDAFCAGWLFLYMLARGRLSDTMRALRTRSGLVVICGALLGGPIGMTGYVLAINNIGPAYTAVISTFYPAFGALLSFLLLGERMRSGQLVALFVALLGVMAMGTASAGDAPAGNALVGLAGAMLAVVGWGSEAVLCAWGMRDDALDNETALQIRETTSALTYVVVVLPLLGAWHFTASAVPSVATGVVALSGLAGATSYLFYYRAISQVGAARAMALNVSYSAWAVAFSFLLQGSVPSTATLVCCVVVLAGTTLAATDWNELFGRRRA